MSFLDKINKMLNVDEDGYYPDDEVDSGSFIEEQPSKPARQSFKNQRADQDKVVNIHTTAQLQLFSQSLKNLTRLLKSQITLMKKEQ